MNDLLKKDVGVKNGLYAAMGAGASQLGEGHVYWMKDMVGDDPAYQAEYNALTPREQQCATHLQTLTRDLMLYSCEMIISPAMKSRVVELFRETTALGNEVQWADATALFEEHLMDVDPRFLAEAVLTVRRDELSALIIWINFFTTMMTYCSDAAIAYPKHVYYTMFMGQVSPKEINHVTFVYPKTQAERDIFDFDDYRTAVKGLPQHNFPPFHQKDVRNFTQNMLVSSSTVKNSGNDGGATNDDSGDDCNGTAKYCKSCKCKHGKGKHSLEGKKRYQAQQKKDREAKGGDNNRNLRRSGRNRKRTEDAKDAAPIDHSERKCFTCGKVHFPYCPPPKAGAVPKCFTCGKNHKPPFCKRGVTEESNTQEEKKEKGLALKAKISKVIAESLNSLFMMMPVWRNQSDICRAHVRAFVPTGVTRDITVCNDTGSSISVSLEENMHDVHDCNSGLIGGFAGADSFDKKGYLVLPNPTKPGSTLADAFVDKGNLPSNVDALLSKKHSAMLGTDMNILASVPSGEKPPRLPRKDQMIPDFVATHKVVGNDKKEYDCRIVDIELFGSFRTGFTSVQYPEGCTVAVRSERVVKLEVGSALNPGVKALVGKPLPSEKPIEATIIVTKGESVWMVKNPGKGYAFPTRVVASVKVALKLVLEALFKTGLLWPTLFGPGDIRVDHDGTLPSFAGPEMVYGTDFSRDKRDVIFSVFTGARGGTNKTHEVNASLKCAEPTCDKNVDGVCPKHGGPKQACCQKHYDSAKAKGLVTSDLYELPDGSTVKFCKGKWVKISEVLKADAQIGCLDDEASASRMTKYRRSTLYRALHGVVSEHTFQMEDKNSSVPIERKDTEDRKILLAAWQAILAVKLSESGDSKVYPSEGPKADMLSIFDGPDGNLNAEVTNLGLEPMPAVDILNEDKFDIMD